MKKKMFPVAANFAPNFAPNSAPNTQRNGDWRVFVICCKPAAYPKSEKSELKKDNNWKKKYIYLQKITAET